jgi:hypothetical protein
MRLAVDHIVRFMLPVPGPACWPVEKRNFSALRRYKKISNQVKLLG